jgi:hypothetical protein
VIIQEKERVDHALPNYYELFYQTFTPSPMTAGGPFFREFVRFFARRNDLLKAFRTQSEPLTPNGGVPSHRRAKRIS